MISVSEARDIIGNILIEFRTRQVSLMKANGYILAENVHSDRDFPPFDRVTMDGIAIDSTVLNGGQIKFEIEHLQPAGAQKSSLSDPQRAIEVMTGTILPENVDAVIRYEDLEISEESDRKFARVLIDSADPFKNVHRQAEDRKKGDLLISTGTLISSPEIAVLATVGKSSVKVFEFPKTAIISTGDELVDIDETPQVHQIRKSNTYAILNELHQLGAKADLFHLTDDKEILEHKLAEILKDYQVLILSGGVSKGKLDFVADILEKLGIEKHFHTIAQRPGKPLWFGSSEKNVVFALPGNPVSTYMCFVVYVKQWFFKCLNMSLAPTYATLDTDASFTPKLTYFMQVNLYFDRDSKLMATPVIGHGSGDHANLLEVDGFIELPEDQTLFNRGSSLPVHLFRKNKVTPDLQTHGTQ